MLRSSLGLAMAPEAKLAAQLIQSPPEGFGKDRGSAGRKWPCVKSIATVDDGSHHDVRQITTGAAAIYVHLQGPSPAPAGEQL